jgi:hypothetical protein
MGVGGRVGKAPVVLPANARHAMVLSCYAGSYWRLSGEVDGDVGCLLIGIQKAAGCCNCKPNNEHQTSLEVPIVGPRGWNRYPSVGHAGRILGSLVPI